MFVNSEIIANKNEEKLSWADLQLYMLKNIFDARTQGNTEEYKSSVTALELTLKGHQDDTYLQDVRLLGKRIDAIREDQGSQIADVMLFDGKLEALTELIFRINKGMQRIRQQLEHSQIIDEIAGYIEKGQGRNLFITGDPGSGKSNTSMAIALLVMQKIGKKFSTKHVVFDSLSFTQTYNNKNKIAEVPYIIYEEAGVGNNAKNSQNQVQKKYNQLLQTIRKKGVLVIFNAPDLSFLDKDARKLLHYWFKTEKHDLNKKEITVSPFVVQVDQRTGNILYPYPVYDGMQLTKIIVPYVPEKYYKAYEKMEIQYKDDLGLETELFLRKNKKSDIEQFRNYIKNREKGLTIKETCEKMKIHRNTGTKLENMRRNAQYAQATL